VSDPLRRDVLAWYQRHKRDLPWRRTRDPYAIWISEIMLQQTRVETVIPFYERFLRRFPDVATLARARETAVLAAWSGLGYYRRARHLHDAARAVVREHGGVMPDTSEGLLTLPGIGGYTASAIASIAFDREEAAVDGNVIRVLARIRGFRGRRDSGALRKRIETIARELARGSKPGDWTQALMELGATICLPREPLCDRGPAARSCAARESGDPARYPEAMPVKAPRVERRLLLLARRGDRVLLVPEDGTAGASWTLPSARLLAAAATPRAARALADRHLAPSSKAAPSGPKLTFQHRTYSHDLTFEVWSVDAVSESGAAGTLWATRAQLRKLPLRAPTIKALKNIR
jgi:A/G-specific adenine glycosylase